MWRYKHLHTSFNFRDFDNIFIASSKNYLYADKLFWADSIKELISEDDLDGWWTFFIEELECLKGSQTFPTTHFSQECRYLPKDLDSNKFEDINLKFENHENNKGQYFMYVESKNEYYCFMFHKFRLSNSGLSIDFRPDELTQCCVKDEGIRSYLNEIKRRSRKNKLNIYLNNDRQ